MLLPLTPCLCPAPDLPLTCPGSGGANQWVPVKNGSNPVPDIMMLTTDIALVKDPSYLKLVKLYASDQTALNVAFSNAWYKLVSRDMGE